MIRFPGWLMLLVSVAAMAADDPVGRCRAQHSSDPPAHIACLERALGAPAPAAPAVVPTEALGAEQVRAKRDDPEQAVVAVQITSATYGANGLGTFTMADGQVWRETEQTPERQRLAKSKQYTARIERGSFGGYRLYVDGIRRMMKIERLQ